MDVAAVRDGLKVRLATVDGLRAYDTIPDSIAVPAAVVVPDEPFIDYLVAMQGGSVQLNFRVTLLTSRSSSRSGQDLLDDLLSAGTGETRSVFDAIRADKTLGGVVADTIPFEAGDYGMTDIEGQQYMKADIRVRVHAGRL